MKGAFVALLLILAAIAQVTVAPLFPVGGVVPNLALMALVMVGMFGGARAVMLGTPVLAISLGFLSDRSPALLLLAYLPLLPLAAYLDTATVPMSRYLQTLSTMVVVGLTLRVLLALAAMSSGAELTIGVLLWQVAFPGMILDAALLTLAYVPLRFVGLVPRALTFERGTY